MARVGGAEGEAHLSGHTAAVSSTAGGGRPSVELEPLNIPRRSSGRRRSIGGAGGEAGDDEGPAKIGGMFGGLADLKKAEMRPEYNVFDFYKENSVFSKVAKSSAFENSTLMVIGFNAIWIGVDTEHNDAPMITKADLVFQVVENIFCVYFTGEVLIRFCAFRRKLDCLKDRWFKFDSILVFLMILETWLMPIFMAGQSQNIDTGQLSILRLLRLLRLTRMVRLMRSVPEVLTLIKGMAAASRSVASTMGLLVSFIYIFGIIFTQQYRESTNAEMLDLFGNMGASILTLFVSGTVLDNLSMVTERILEDNPTMLAVFIAFVLLSSFTVLNMLIGILCEVVSATAVGEQERLLVREAKLRLTSVFQQIDEDGSGMINRDEFDLMKVNEDATRALEALGVEPKHLFILSDTIFEQDNDEKQDLAKKSCMPGMGSPSSNQLSNGSRNTNLLPVNMGASLTNPDDDDEGATELTFEEFLEIVVHLRPGTSASVLDIADLRRALRQKTKSLTMTMRRIQEMQEKHDRLLEEMRASFLKSGPGTQPHMPPIVQIVMPRRRKQARASKTGRSQQVPSGAGRTQAQGWSESDWRPPGGNDVIPGERISQAASMPQNGTSYMVTRSKASASASLQGDTSTPRGSKDLKCNPVLTPTSKPDSEWTDVSDDPDGNPDDCDQDGNGNDEMLWPL